MRFRKRHVVGVVAQIALCHLYHAALAQEQSGYVITTVAGSGVRGFNGDGDAATNAALSNPGGIAVDVAGNLYIAESTANRIRRVSPGGIISTVAGQAGKYGFSGDGGPAIAALLATPFAVAVDGTGALYIADCDDNLVRKISALGTITTVAGVGANGFDGDGGAATAAKLSCPAGLAVDQFGSLYIADGGNNRIRKVSSSGIIMTIAGSGRAMAQGSFSGDGGPATAATLANPMGIALDVSNNLYIADVQNNRIRKISPSGVITTVVGSGPTGDIGSFAGDGGLATLARLSHPRRVAVDEFGNIFICDTGNHRVRRVSPSGMITTFAGSGPVGVAGAFGGDGGPGTEARLNNPDGVSLDATGNVFIADTGNQRVRRLSRGPSILPEGVVNAASGLTGAIAPGEFVTIYGAALATGAPLSAQGLARGLGKTRVFMSGIESFLTYASANQVNALVPYGVGASGQVVLRVENDGISSNSVFLRVVDASPGIFTLNGSGVGPAVVVNQDGTLNSSANPASRNSIISFFATGQGQTDPPMLDGVQPTVGTFPRPTAPVSVSIGGIKLRSEDVLFAGSVYAGVLQVNVRIPAGVLPGDLVEIVLTVGTYASRTGATLPAAAAAIR